MIHVYDTSTEVDPTRSGHEVAVACFVSSYIISRDLPGSYNSLVLGAS